MPKFYRTNARLGNDWKTVIAINHTDEGPQTKKLNVPVQHNIILIDQSLSMTYEIDKLIDQVEKSFEHIGDQDYVSVIGFSSYNQCKVYIRGARKDDSIKTFLDSMRRTIGQTCFSTPLREAEEVVDDLASICPNFAVTLFTDGNPVTPWSEYEEESKIFKILDTLGKKVIAINTIGYGYYYNQELLLAMANRSEYGNFIHSRDIADYSKIFSHNYERVSELAVGTIEVKAPGVELLYLTDRNTKLTKDELSLRMMAKGKNQIFLIGDGEFSFDYNGNTYQTSTLQATKIRTDTLRNMYYAYAYNAYYQGMRHVSLDVLAKNVGDKAFVDSHLYAFTYDEVSRHVEKLRKAVFNVRDRYVQGTCDEDYIPKDDQTCVVDILNILAGDSENYYMPISYSNYNRVGRQTVDTHSILLDRQVDDGRSPFTDLVFHKTRLNISVRHRIRRIAQLNPKAAKRVGLPDQMQVELVRHQTIIKDGNLNMPYIEALVTDATKDVLNSRGVQFDVRRGKDADGLTHIRVELEDVPIINRTYITKDTAFVLRTVNELLHLEAEQKTLRYFLEFVRHNTSYKEGEYKKFTPEQIDVLRDHGIDYKLNYIGINNETLESQDFYETRSLEFQIKGASNLPKIDDVISKMNNGGRLNAISTYIGEYITTLRDEFRAKGIDMQSAEAGDIIKEKLSQLKRQIVEKRVMLNSLKIAKVVTGDWFEGTTVDSKGNFTYTDDGVTLVIKPGREKVEI